MDQDVRLIVLYAISLPPADSVRESTAAVARGEIRTAEDLMRRRYIYIWNVDSSTRDVEIVVCSSVSNCSKLTFGIFNLNYTVALFQK